MASFAVMRCALVVWMLMCGGLGLATAQDLDSADFRRWGEEEWKALVVADPEAGRAFAKSKFTVLALEHRDVVNVAYALGLAEYLLGRHLVSNDWYEFALEHPDLVGRRGAVWSNEKEALRKEAALYNNIGVNFEIMEDFISAEAAYANCQKTDLLLGDTDAAWKTSINIGFLRYCEHQYEEAKEILTDALAYFRESGDRHSQGLALLNLGLTEHRLSPGGSGLSQAHEAVEIFVDLGDSTEAMRSLVACGQMVDALGDDAAMRGLFAEMDAMRPAFVPHLIDYEVLVLRARLAGREEEWDKFYVLVEEIEQMAEAFPELLRTDEELEVLMTAAHARGGLPALFEVFRKHGEDVRRQFSQRSAQVLAEAWALNDREVQMHQMEQLEVRLSFAQRLNVISGFAFLLALVASGLLIWKRKTDQRNQWVIVRLLRQRRQSGQKHRSGFGGSEKSEKREKVLQEVTTAPSFEELFSSLEQLLTKEQIQRNQNITLGELASRLNSNTKYLSSAIRQATSMGFNEYINMLRVHDAQGLMLTEGNGGLSFDQIAEECGFGTRRTFYRQFTKFTGMPPGQFLKAAEEDRTGDLGLG